MCYINNLEIREPYSNTGRRFLKTRGLSAIACMRSNPNPSFKRQVRKEKPTKTVKQLYVQEEEEKVRKGMRMEYSGMSGHHWGMPCKDWARKGLKTVYHIQRSQRTVTMNTGAAQFKGTSFWVCKFYFNKASIKKLRGRQMKWDIEWNLSIKVWLGRKQKDKGNNLKQQTKQPPYSIEMILKSSWLDFSFVSSYINYIALVSSSMKWV